KPLQLMCVNDDWPEKSLDNRRTDIWAEFSDCEDQSSCSHLLLGELKILAPFTKGQAEAYRRRGEKVCGPFCKHSLTLLIAPKRYLDAVGTDGDSFQIKMSLEDIKRFFDNPAADVKD